jgi:GH18 family chitinase
MYIYIYICIIDQELREAFYFESLASRKEQLMLTLAVGAEKKTVLNGYDVGSLVSDVDFINVMSYDYHGSWDNVAGHNSPLYSRADHELTVDYSIRLFLSLGVPLNKLIVR